MQCLIFSKELTLICPSTETPGNPCWLCYSRENVPVSPIQSSSSMHHYECIALCKDISLQRGRFCTRSLASCIPRSSKNRSSWMFFIQVVCGHPGGRLQFSGGGSKMAWLASAFSSIRARCPKKVRQQDLMMDESGGWLVMRRMTAFLTVRRLWKMFVM